LGYPVSGIACALSIPKHEQCPFDSLDQNNLVRGVYLMPQTTWYCFS